MLPRASTWHRLTAAFVAAIADDAPFERRARRSRAPHGARDCRSGRAADECPPRAAGDGSRSSAPASPASPPRTCCSASTTSRSTRPSRASAGTRTPTTSSPPTAGVVPIDSGFIVHNLSTYPNLLRLFGELGVETQPTDMSMSVRCDGCGLEYAGAKGLGGIFAQPANAANPRFLRMLVEVKRFHRAAHRLLDGAEPAARTDGGAAHPRRLPRRRALLPLLPCSTSWCRWSRACGRARPAPRCSTRPARCSRSSTTTAR